MRVIAIYKMIEKKTLCVNMRFASMKQVAVAFKWVTAMDLDYSVQNRIVWADAEVN